MGRTHAATPRAEIDPARGVFSKCILEKRQSINATIVDLRYNMKKVLSAIDRGETVTVLYRGKERAKLTPITPALSGTAPKTRDQPLFGLWKERADMNDPASYVR